MKGAAKRVLLLAAWIAASYIVSQLAGDLNDLLRGAVGRDFADIHLVPWLENSLVLLISPRLGWPVIVTAGLFAGFERIALQGLFPGVYHGWQFWLYAPFSWIVGASGFSLIRGWLGFIWWGAWHTAWNGWWIAG